MSSYLNNIPKHWVVTELGNILKSLETSSRPKGGVKNIKEGIPSIGAEHLNNDGGFNFEKIKYIPEDFAKKLSRGKVELGDILVVKDGATTGKVSFISESFPFKLAFVNEHVFICKIFDFLVKKFFFYYLKSKTGQDQIISNFHGAAQGGITTDFVNHVTIPLPPLNEQKRIVEKLDAILPKVKSAKARLENIPQILKKFRQVVLHYACTGKLTEDWREQNKHEITKQRNNNNQTQNYSFDELPFEIDELPEGWEVKKIRELALINPRNVLDDELDVSFIPMALISNRFNELPKFEPRKWKEVKSGFTHFKDNDVIIAKITPSFENGKAAIVKGLVNGYGAGTTELYVLRCTNEILPEYLYYYVKTDIFIEKGKKLMTGTAGQLRVPREYIENYLILKPPLPEQHEIVRRVEKLFAIADKIEEQYKKAMERVGKLEQSILAKAFRGELVEPDPNDEPAEELLKRILAEKGKIENNKKKSESKKKKVKAI